MSGWNTVRLGRILNDTHIVPVDDTMKHSLTNLCLCRPKVDLTLRRVVVHFAADGREYFEPDHYKDDDKETVS